MNDVFQVAKKTSKVKGQRTTFFALVGQDQCECYRCTCCAIFFNQLSSNILSLLTSVLMKESFINLTCHLKCVSFVSGMITCDTSR